MLEDLWARLTESVARTLPTPVLDNWIRPCRLVAVEGDHLRIGAPNKFSRDWVAQNYLDALHQAAREVLGGNRDKLEAITQALMEFETINGEEVNALMRGEKPEPSSPI